MYKSMREIEQEELVLVLTDKGRYLIGKTLA